MKLSKKRHKLLRNLAFPGDKLVIHYTAVFSSPQKRKGTSPTLNADDVNQILSSVESSPENLCKTRTEIVFGPFVYLSDINNVLLV
ncbi:unnamed protein product [Blumeria hordei]|uniref:Uncharacterized protein n=1 Tax=Blumeria hordei TaxID=2867405 RepID=A0A383UJK9_BLUHO|nr:unnamed protein product [Blumeria hordei]